MSDEWFETATADMAVEAQEIKDEAEYDEWTESHEDGDVLKAVFLKAIPKPTKFGGGFLLVVKDLDKDTNVKVWCSRQSLKDGVVDAAPKPGKLMAIEYEGQITTGNGYTMNLYLVRAEVADREYWDALGVELSRKQKEFDEKRDDKEVNPADPDEISPF